MNLRASLQTTFVSIVALALAVVLALVGLLWQRQALMQQHVVGISRRAVHASASEGVLRYGEALASQFATSVASPLSRQDLDAVQAIARSVRRRPDVAYVVVYDNAGAVLHDDSRGVTTDSRPMPDTPGPAILDDRTRIRHGKSVVDVSTPVALGGPRLGRVQVGFSLAPVQAEELRAGAALRAELSTLGQRNRGWIAALLGLLLVSGLALMGLMQRTLVKPIRRLADAARAIEQGNFDVDLPSSERADEVGDLVRAFRRMGQSIARHDRDIRHMAYTDALTGLANRLAFREALDHRLMTLSGAGPKLALLFCDIDDFKRVNDTLGHDAGDEVLVRLTARIRSTVRRLGGENALLARFGGDEFVILLEADQTHGDDVRDIASRLADALVAELSRPMLVRERQVFLGTSIGLTLFPEDASGAALLMKNGDIAMYQAKIAGKNCHRFYSRAMDQALERRVQMEQELRGAWDRDELSVAYQPIYRMTDGRLVGAEALLRWQHPEHGTIAPSVFIDVAEQSGLIESIGPLAMRTACVDAMRWRSEPHAPEGMFVSVNVSPRQLCSGDLGEVVAACLRDSGLAAGRLHIELTETSVIGDEVHARGLLSRLRATGVKVWLDDFGTGFSGLSHLRRVPVDGVKIDRSFIADVLRDPDDLALTSAIIAMAHSLGITVVAEGVEKEGQYAILRERGCDLAQGYWLGHPLSSQDFSHLLA